MPPSPPLPPFAPSPPPAQPVIYSPPPLRSPPPPPPESPARVDWAGSDSDDSGWELELLRLTGSDSNSDSDTRAPGRRLLNELTQYVERLGCPSCKTLPRHSEFENHGCNLPPRRPSVASRIQTKAHCGLLKQPWVGGEKGSSFLAALIRAPDLAVAFEPTSSVRDSERERAADGM